MRPRQPVPEDLLRLSALQAGVVTREQALGTGFGASGIVRLLDDGQWRRITRGVYLTLPLDPSWSAWAWAGVLVGGDQARLGGLAAAHLAGLEPEPPDAIVVLLPATGGVPTRPGPWSFHRERPGARSPRTYGSPPRVSIEDTVLDLSSGADPAVAVHWVTAAVQARLTTPDRLRRAMTRRRFVPQRRVLTDLLADVAAGVRSPLELRYLRDVERAHGLPVGRRQVARRRTEVDVVYDAWRLLVELDGRVGHSGTDRFRDLARDNAATSDGLATLRYGHHDVAGAPCEVAAQVAGTLALRGWTGLPTRCDRCRRVA